MATVNPIIIPKAEVWRFVHDSIRTQGVSDQHAGDLADLLMEADHRGHFSHGLNRLHLYVNDVKNGLIETDKEPVIVEERPATALVDGNNVLGPVVAKFAMRVAMRKAKEAGIGWVTVRHSNHFGIAGWYSMMAAEEGLVGMSFTNSSPITIPTRSKKTFTGSNPISMAVPAQSPEDSMVVDLATTTVALGKVEMAHRKNVSIPTTWGADAEGKPTTDPGAVLAGGGLLPLGGSEETGGYKGFCLGLLVETICSLMSGGEYGGDVRGWKATTGKANYSQCFAAIDPAAFGVDLPARMSDFARKLRSQERSGSESVLVPGDPERSHIELCSQNGGIPYHPNLVASLNSMATSLDVRAMIPK